MLTICLIILGLGLWTKWQNTKHIRGLVAEQQKAASLRNMKKIMEPFEHISDDNLLFDWQRAFRQILREQQP